LRLFDSQEGEILIDGQNIRFVQQDSLRQHIGVIPQEPPLFHRTLMENIRYGAPRASDEAVMDAARQARCHEFITALPDGYATEVGERGVKLSGGQRQRIAIARALLRNAPILILDEATSALDSVTEESIHDVLLKKMHGRTTLVIAHRLSTLLEMDRLIVLDHGCIIEMGTHVELLTLQGHYARMWNRQVGGFLPERETM
jgi:ATP-binding cassette subfamily B protein